MSDYVQFEKDGLYFYEWENRQHTKSRLEDACAINALRHECRIAEGVTLLDFFDAVDELPSLMNFIARYSWCRAIHDFHEQARLPEPTEQGERGSIEELVISFGGDFHPPFGFSHGLDFSGKGPDKEGVPTSWALELSPVNTFSRLPLRLAEKAHFTYWPDDDVQSPGWHEKVRYEEAPYSFSLLEVLDAVYMEISFFGGPEQVAAKFEEISGAVAEAKQALADGTLKFEDAPDLEADSK